MQVKNKKKKYISTTEAKNIAFVDRVTIINWCKQHKIGKKVVGRWQVDPEKLKELIGE